MDFQIRVNPRRNHCHYVLRNSPELHLEISSSLPMKKVREDSQRFMLTNGLLFRMWGIIWRGHPGMNSYTVDMQHPSGLAAVYAKVESTFFWVDE